MLASRRLAILFAFYAAIAIVLVAVAMPPFQAADELAHAERADQIGLGGLIATRDADGSNAGGIAHSALVRLATPFDPLRFHPKVKVDADMRAASAGIRWDGTARLAFPNTAIYPPALYVPAALGLAIGRAAHLSVLQTMTLARLLAGGVSAAIAVLAIALSGGCAPLLFAILCLPMTLALFGSLSQDGPMIACAALGAVLLARPASVRTGFWVGCALLALVSMARPAYLPLCLAPLLAPQLSRGARIAGALVPLAATAGWIAVTDRWTMPTASALHVAQQLAAIRHDPSILPLLVHTTLHAQWVEGFPEGREFIGVLGWLDTTLPNPYYALTGCMMLAAAAMSQVSLPGRPLPRGLLALALLAGTVCAIYAAQYLSWSRIGGGFVDGVQGRYFLPLAPFLLFVLRHRRWMPPRYASAAFCAYPAFSIAVTARAILLRYYLG